MIAEIKNLIEELEDKALEISGRSDIITEDNRRGNFQSNNKEVSRLKRLSRYHV